MGVFSGVIVELGTCFTGVETELINGGTVVFSLSLVVDGEPLEVEIVLLPSVVGSTVVAVEKHPSLQHSLHSRGLHCFRLSSKVCTSLLRQPDTIWLMEIGLKGFNQRQTGSQVPNQMTSFICLWLLNCVKIKEWNMSGTSNEELQYVFFGMQYKKPIYLGI